MNEHRHLSPDEEEMLPTVVVTLFLAIAVIWGGVKDGNEFENIVSPLLTPTPIAELYREVLPEPTHFEGRILLP